MDSAAVKSFFDSVSTDWDNMRSAFYNERVIDTLAERARVDPSSTVVDVGTGTGFVASGLASRSSHVIGIDQSTAMLDVARENLRELAVDNVRLVDGAFDQLPLADGSVDASVANMVLHHAPEPVAMLEEMTRVVRPGGWVAITDEVEHTYEWMRAEQADIWLGFTTAQVARFFEDVRLVDYGYASLGMQ